VRVDDGTAQAVFVVFDSDMAFLVGLACHDLVASAKVIVNVFHIGLIGCTKCYLTA
jgi:hypothetical protein